MRENESLRYPPENPRIRPSLRGAGESGALADLPSSSFHRPENPCTPPTFSPLSGALPPRDKKNAIRVRRAERALLFLAPLTRRGVGGVAFTLSGGFSKTSVRRGPRMPLVAQPTMSLSTQVINLPWRLIMKSALEIAMEKTSAIGERARQELEKLSPEQRRQDRRDQEGIRGENRRKRRSPPTRIDENDGRRSSSKPLKRNSNPRPGTRWALSARNSEASVRRSKRNATRK